MTPHEVFVENTVSIMGIHNELIGRGHFITANLLIEKLRKLAVAFRESNMTIVGTGDREEYKKQLIAEFLRECGLEADNE